MNIDDFLKREQLQDLAESLTNEMNITAGENLVSRRSNRFETPEKVRDRYYTPVPAFGGERPHDLCKRGDKHLVEEVLNRLDHGIYS